MILYNNFKKNKNEIELCTEHSDHSNSKKNSIRLDEIFLNLNPPDVDKAMFDILPIRVTTKALMPDFKIRANHYFAPNLGKNGHTINFGL
jgi:hypothetical protein